MRLPAIIVLGLVAVAAPAHATSTPRAGGLFAPSGALPVVASDAHVEVRGPFADVVVTQTFRNDLDRGVEAVYVFPLPGDAAVRAMTIRTGDQTITAAIERRADARRAYEDAVAAGTVAALTEEERADVFTQQVTGIAAGAEVTVELRYDMAIGRTADGWELVLPLVVAPRHVPGEASGKPTQGTGSSPDTDQVGDASRVTPPVRGDKAGAGNTMDVTIDLGDVAKATVDVPSHDATVAERRGHTKVTVHDARSDRDLVVRWAGVRKGAVEALAERADAGGVVAITIETPRPAATAKRAHRRWLLALDTSGSMDGDALAVLKAAAHALVAGVGDDAVAILGDGAPSWRHGKKGRAKLGAAIDALAAGGAVELGDLLAAAQAAAAGAGDGDEVAIVLISDALAADDAAVAARVDGARRVHVIGVGPAPDRWLLDEIARRGQGAEVVVGVGDDADAAVAALVAAAGAPAVTPELDWGGLAVRDVTPATLPAMAAGRAVVVAAAVDRLADAKIVVRAGEATLRTTLIAADAGDDGLVGRRWARGRVAELVASGGDSETIAELGLAHGLVTPYTALVATGAKVTVAGGVKTTVAIPVAMPAGMRWQAVFGKDGDAGVALPDDLGGDGEDDAELATTDGTSPAKADKAGKKERRDHEKAKQPQSPRGDDAREPGRTVATSDTATTGTPTQQTNPPAEPVAAAGEAMADEDYGTYGETIQLSGAVMSVHRWSGELSLATGLYLRGDQRGASASVAAGASYGLGDDWQLGLAARLAAAPAVDHGIDLAAYVTARRLIRIAWRPLLAIDAALGASLDEPGVAWRFGLRLGPWRLAPELGLDQVVAPDPDQDGHPWTTRTTVDVGVGWRF